MATPSSGSIHIIVCILSLNLSARLVNPYVQPTLYVRAPGDDYEQVYRFDNDDPFFSEVSDLLYTCIVLQLLSDQVSNLIDVIEDGPQSAEILSSYEGQYIFRPLRPPHACY